MHQLKLDKSQELWVRCVLTYVTRHVYFELRYLEIFSMIILYGFRGIFLHYCYQDKRKCRKENLLKKSTLSTYIGIATLLSVPGSFLFCSALSILTSMRKDYSVSHILQMGISVSKLRQLVLYSWAEWWIQVNSCYFLTFILLFSPPL